MPTRRVAEVRLSELDLLVHRLAYNGDVVAFKMGRRPEEAGRRMGVSASWKVRLLFNTAIMARGLDGVDADPPTRFPWPSAHLQRNPSIYQVTTYNFPKRVFHVSRKFTK